MKLTATQLRKIIAEEVAAARGGRRLSEAAEDVGLAASQFVDLTAASWADSYDDADPVMAHAGQDAWDAQVDAARAELDERMEEVLRDVEDKLFGGAYA